MLLNNNINLHNSDKLSINIIIPICIGVSLVKIVILYFQYTNSTEKPYLGIIQDFNMLENDDEPKTVSNKNKSVIYVILNVVIMCVCIAIFALKNKNKDDKNISRLFAILNILLRIDIVILLPIYLHNNKLDYENIEKIINYKLKEKYKYIRNNFENELDTTMNSIINNCYNRECIYEKENEKLNNLINKIIPDGLAPAPTFASAPESLIVKINTNANTNI